ncbi:MAG: hypothetical protein IIU38_02945 [Bacteroidaceae bacterium]|nr:hypothetical protein [Bacteroidaceae bacterium]
MTYINRISDKFDFGKFKGCSLAEILYWNPDYVNWVVENVSGVNCVISDDAVKEIELMFPNFLITSWFEYCRQRQLSEYIGFVEDDPCELEECCWGNNENEMYDEPTYECYRGFYAQSVMGYSDDEIDTIFDGDPNAYWNID